MKLNSCFLVHSQFCRSHKYRGAECQSAQYFPGEDDSPEFDLPIFLYLMQPVVQLISVSIHFNFAQNKRKVTSKKIPVLSNKKQEPRREIMQLHLRLFDDSKKLQKEFVYAAIIFLRAFQRKFQNKLLHLHAHCD